MTMGSIPGESESCLPLSALNQFLYCARRAALRHTEGMFRENQFTTLGTLAHEHADFPGYEAAKGVVLLRALPIGSDRLRLSGRCDIVERRPDGTLYPVEYKRGRRRRFDNDDAQLCAQALCLEEMFAQPIATGAIFHASSKRRREVAFTPRLRAATEDAIAGLHRLLGSGEIPPAVYRDACKQCSLFPICLPQVTSRPPGLPQMSSALFQV